MDIVLFKELNWTKIYHTTFVTFLWDITLVIEMSAGCAKHNFYKYQKYILITITLT